MSIIIRCLLTYFNIKQRNEVKVMLKDCKYPLMILKLFWENTFLIFNIKMLAKYRMVLYLCKEL